ncbi:HPt (histidine-containing phosphotransfer) domain-containing protein [Sinorhizobium terangae]|uniref:Hpt domain-containing protein n=1 Tax=Sinorhizobium terangae TaxID=110322 RepID=A0A6N7LJS5_SINTE|nr:Hpt domain-containing protein [Sinorhizobium terangae]MBB4187498.1 HPt (histidine-containing phosphotransfer) domain-containing protein [Sinorhizobium terangae]MQX16994.1 Hpt domain-containing protein [Sinorhizobium terangae]
MAALKIAFEAPDNPGSSSLGKKPIDFALLGKQTMGDKELEIEVLQLFARQARQAVAEIAAGDADRRVQAAHRLKGAALAVGAVDVAEAAAAIEREPGNAILVGALGAAVLVTELFILKLCR